MLGTPAVAAVEIRLGVAGAKSDGPGEVLDGPGELVLGEPGLPSVVVRPGVVPGQAAWIVLDKGTASGHLALASSR